MLQEYLHYSIRVSSNLNCVTYDSPNLMSLVLRLATSKVSSHTSARSVCIETNTTLTRTMSIGKTQKRHLLQTLIVRTHEVNNSAICFFVCLQNQRTPPQNVQDMCTVENLVSALIIVHGSYSFSDLIFTLDGVRCRCVITARQPIVLYCAQIEDI